MLKNIYSTFLGYKIPFKLVDYNDKILQIYIIWYTGSEFPKMIFLSQNLEFLDF